MFQGMRRVMLLAGSNADYNTMTQTLLTFFNQYLIPSLMTIASAVFLVLGIINGIRWAKAVTDEEKVKAKKAVIGLGIGLVISVVSIWLIPYLLNFLSTIFMDGGLEMQE